MSLIILVMLSDVNLKYLYLYLYLKTFNSSVYFCVFLLVSKCLVAAREAKVLARVAPSVIARYYVITSRASRSQPSVVLLAVVV